jgi:hypothetical protein
MDFALVFYFLCLTLGIIDLLFNFTEVTPCFCERLDKLTI